MRPSESVLPYLALATFWVVCFAAAFTLVRRLWRRGPQATHDAHALRDLDEQVQALEHRLARLEQEARITAGAAHDAVTSADHERTRTR